MWGTNDIALIGLLSFATLFPFLIAGGTCFIKFSIVFSLIKNAIGLQQVPSTLTLNSLALLLAAFVMFPIANKVYDYSITEKVDFHRVESVQNFVDEGLGDYKKYLFKFSDKSLLKFFDDIYTQQQKMSGEDRILSGKLTAENASLFSLLVSYALSEIKDAFILGFYIYLPFIVVDLVVSNILLALGMMMMSPVTISLPIKLILFVAIDGWSKVATGMVMQYSSLWKG
ncbi:type III secretion system protein [Klebsiella sp. RIT-PI-d]|uniref:EscR/YscR/HrcR family type III secretion system export apparatus protein n=1 Tax=Klebsiella sp. RIT-PI-d TaxID=1681196 RepID=UPI000675E970|nr:EscR/YscR/HrcR family type III secretion system export apparatus protein [Klebsiella sp. RIT-PI-d]KNC09801.1 type III secretion system protein [Klebsiella sp. RIT-PI-d]